MANKSRARALAMRLIIESCVEAVRRSISSRIRSTVESRMAFLAEIDKRFRSAEIPIARAVRSIWREEERIILANLRRMKAVLGATTKPGKDKIEQIIYPEAKFKKKLAMVIRGPIRAAILDSAEQTIGKFGFEIAFNQQSPFVRNYLEKLVPDIAGMIEDTSREKLRRLLEKNILDGKGVDDIARDIKKTFSDWTRKRAENIARTESIKATNHGAVEAYKQSGVVAKKEWMTNFTKDENACDDCLDLDGEVVELDENFEAGDYSEPAPPLHPRCRCTVLPVTKDIEEL